MLNFTPTGFVKENLSRGQTVNVWRKDCHDMFNHDFTGTIVEINEAYIVVEDQDGDCFSCDADQLSFNTDEIIHGN